MLADHFDLRDTTGDPLYDPNRHTRAQTFTWNEDGTEFWHSGAGLHYERRGIKA
ncbi:hypothetical protein [Paenibacillus motobuensis]|uniref:Uncharacterized protein n=1 Tax=Paenibacillus motobuensis TaxID=295324 RepID=A0ABP3HR86_9BACL